MGDEVAQLRQQLAEKDAKILEVKEKAKQFVRERMAASATAIENYKTSAAQQDATIAELHNGKAALEAKMAELEKTISTQLATIKDMSGKSNDTQALEQRNRELHNRSENMKEEVAVAKSRLKALQKDLAAERAELAELKKYDPQRLRKNLDASKKKLAEKTTAADKLQKSLTQARSENSQLELKIKELESQLETADTAQSDQAPDEQEAA